MKKFLVAGLSSILLTSLLCGGSKAAETPSASPSTSASPAATPDAQQEKAEKERAETEKTARIEAADFQRICANQFHLPFSRKLVFSLDGTQAYAILPVATAPDKASATPAGSVPERKLAYFDIQPMNGVAIPEFAVRNTLNADLVVTLDNRGFASSMAAAVLAPAFANCGRGDMELISGFTGTSGPVRRKGFLGVVPSFRVPILYDPLTRNLLQLDTDTMQSRLMAKVPPGLHIVYADPLGGKLTLWDNGKRTLSVVAFKSAGDPAKLRSIKVKDGFQILQSGGRYAAMRVSPAENSITIHEIPAWTGVTKEGEYKFKLPAAFNVSQAQVWANFDRKIAVVTAKTDDVRRRWQKVFLLDYATGQVIHEFTGKGTDYFGEAGISPNTKTIVVVSMNGNQGVADKILVRDLVKNSTREIKLTTP